MLLTGLTLKNIRSYGSEGTSIGLRPGITLFEGDIGTGKSTILAAIEFGLFGLGDVEARHLLRHGAKKGLVKVSFEVGGHQYSVSRTLARSGRGIQQEECSLEGEGVSGVYSPTELKPIVLEILGFNEKPEARSTSRIFRYAVYTPQEAMKEVLSMKEEQRLDTLRRAFSIEQYSWVVSNVEEAVTREWLNTRLAALEVEIRDLPQAKEELEKEKEGLVKIGKDQGELTRREAEASGRRQRAQTELFELEPKKTLVVGLRNEIPHIQQELVEAKKRLRRAAEDEEDLTRDLMEASESAERLEKLRPTHEEFSAKKSRLAELEPSVEENAELAASAQALVAALEASRKRLEEDVSRLEGEAAGVAEARAKIPATEEAISALKTRQKELAGELEELQAVEEAVHEMEKEKARLEAEIRAKEKDIRRNREEWKKIERIGVGAPCPLCQQELTQEHFRSVQGEYTQRLAALEAEEDPMKRQLAGVNTQVEEAAQRLKVLDPTVVHAKEVDIMLERTEGDLKAIRKELARLAEAENELESKRELLKNESYLTHERSELSAISERMAKLSPTIDALRELKKRVAELEGTGVEGEFIRLQGKADNKPVLSSRLLRAREGRADAEAKVSALEEELKSKTAQLKEGTPVLSQIEETEARLRLADEDLSAVREEGAALRAKAEGVSSRITTLEGEMERGEKSLREKALLDQTRRWLKEVFVPSVSTIEKQVLASINEEFDMFFQRWFSTLMEVGDISVRIDESFSPLIEQDGYEIDSASLSGGERTSLALAYRLALNTMVKRQSGSRESGLLILDEPTDGFSSGQLLRLRDILQETGCEQIIMVSHEKELESFVDNIFVVAKPGGESVVTMASR
jgi:exonuclease SbcC